MGILDWAMPLADIAGNVITNSLNAEMQNRTNLQNLALQREQWARDDNAVQRRKADLEKAGFNPILATGASADSSLAVRMGAPQFVNPDIGSAIERGIRANNARQQMALTQAQVDAELPRLRFEAEVWSNIARDPANALKYAELYKDNAKLDWEMKAAQRSKVIADYNNAVKQGGILDLNANLLKKYGNANAILGLVGSAVQGAAGLKNIAFPSNRR